MDILKIDPSTLKIKNVYKLYYDTYLITTNYYLFVVKVNDRGEITKVSYFGNKTANEGNKNGNRSTETRRR